MLTQEAPEKGGQVQQQLPSLPRRASLPPCPPPPGPASPSGSTRTIHTIPQHAPFSRSFQLKERKTPNTFCPSLFLPCHRDDVPTETEASSEEPETCCPNLTPFTSKVPEDAVREAVRRLQVGRWPEGRRGYQPSRAARQGRPGKASAMGEPAVQTPPDQAGPHEGLPWQGAPGRWLCGPPPGH